jgi:carbonic anhydrase
MPDELLERLRRFQTDAFPLQRSLFRHLVDEGQHPLTLFIGCSDSRLVPYLLTGAGPGELFLVRNVGAFVPPYDQSQGFHGTAAAIEFAVLNLHVQRVIVCGHSHCGAIRALYGEVPAAAQNLARWLDLGREAALPVAEPGPEVLRRTEQRDGIPHGAPAG